MKFKKHREGITFSESVGNCGCHVTFGKLPVDEAKIICVFVFIFCFGMGVGEIF